MAGAIVKWVPTATVAAVVGWCCWPYLDDAGPREITAKTSSPQIAHALLEPAVAADLPRDPFRIAGTTKPPGPPKDGVAPGAKASATSRSTQKKDSAEMPKGLTLSGTYIAGNRRAALINGRLWEQGQRLELSGSAATPWVLAQVFPYGVVIESGAKSFELKYPGPGDRPDRMAPIPAAAPALTNHRAGPGIPPPPAGQSAPARTVPAPKGKLSNARR